MKTINEVKNNIADNLKEMGSKRVNPKIYNKLSCANKILTQVVMYLETNPRKEFIESEKNRISNIIQAKESQFDYWSKNICPFSIDVKKRKSLFNKEQGLSALKNQLQVLTYIIN